MNKKRIIILLLSILLIVGAVAIGTVTVSSARDRIIYEKENEVIEEVSTEEIPEATPIEGEAVMGEEMTTTEEEVDTSNSYNYIELSIMIIASIVLIGTIIALIITKAGKISIFESVNTNKRLIYTSIIVVMLCSIVPVLNVVATDKLILNSYATKGKDEKSLAIIEILENKKEANIKENATEENMSVIQVSKGSSYELKNSTISKKGGATTDEESSNNFGLNSAFIVKDGSTVTLNKLNIETTTKSAQGFFATGINTNGELSEITINTKADKSNALVVANSSNVNIENSNLNTKGQDSHGIKVINSESNLSVTNTTINTENNNSALFYSTGNITATNITGNSNKGPIGLVEGIGNVEIIESKLSTNAHGIDKDSNLASAFFIYNKEVKKGSDSYETAKLSLKDSEITINDDSENYEQAPLFLVTNTNANINVTNTKFNYGSDTLIKVTSLDKYGESGNSGANLTFTATDERLVGDIEVDEASQVKINLNNSTYRGQINKGNKSANVNIIFDYDSSWDLTGNSYVNTISVTKKDLNNVRKYIRSHGYNVYYNPDNNEWLYGRVYYLYGGGNLIPLRTS